MSHDRARHPAAANDQENEERTAALKQLGLALDRRGFRVRVSRPVQGPSFLTVTSPVSGSLSENVTCRLGDGDEPYYLYSWGDPIASARNVESAAERLVRVLTPQDAA